MHLLSKFTMRHRRHVSSCNKHTIFIKFHNVTQLKVTWLHWPWVVWMVLLSSFLAVTGSVGCCVGATVLSVTTVSAPSGTSGCNINNNNHGRYVRMNHIFIRYFPLKSFCLRTWTLGGLVSHGGIWPSFSPIKWLAPVSPVAVPASPAWSLVKQIDNRSW